MAKGVREWFEFGKKNLTLIYILFLCGALFPIFVFIGAILAYVNKDDSLDNVYHSHYIFILRTFWIGLIGLIISIITIPLLIGILLYGIVMIWLAIRIIAGMNLLIKDRQHPNPQTWGFIK